MARIELLHGTTSLYADSSIMSGVVPESKAGLCLTCCEETAEYYAGLSEDEWHSAIDRGAIPCPRLSDWQVSLDHGLAVKLPASCRYEAAPD